MKKILLITPLILLFLCSCNEVKKAEKDTNYKIIGTVNNLNNSTVYLSKFLNYSILNIDSSLVKNDTFYFKGKVIYPEKYLLHFKNSSNKLLFILENTEITINMDAFDFKESKIKGSFLNNELKHVKNQSEAIYKNIEYLYPSIQKARLENDVKKLASLNDEIKAIENQNIDLIINYCEQNPTSYLSPILLNDLINSYPTLDSIKVTSIYNSFSSEVKKCTDAKLIADKLF